VYYVFLFYRFWMLHHQLLLTKAIEADRSQGIAHMYR
jgi:hypothetical protein